MLIGRLNDFGTEGNTRNHETTPGVTPSLTAASSYLYSNASPFSVAVAETSVFCPATVPGAESSPGSRFNSGDGGEAIPLPKPRLPARVGYQNLRCAQHGLECGLRPDGYDRARIAHVDTIQSKPASKGQC